MAAADGGRRLGAGKVEGVGACSWEDEATVKKELGACLQVGGRHS